MDRTAIIVALIGAIAAVVVGYWQFGSVSNEPPKTPSTEVQDVEYLGRVVNAKNQDEKVGGAKITLQFRGAPPIVYTDGEGVYRFVVNMNGDKLPGRVFVEADGYKTYDRNITLLANNTSIEDIRLMPTN